MMFGLNNWFNRGVNRANDEGHTVGYLGLDGDNPYPPNTTDHYEWEKGRKEGIELAQEEANTISPQFNEFGDWL